MNFTYPYKTQTHLYIELKCDGKLLSLFKHVFVKKSAKSGKTENPSNSLHTDIIQATVARTAIHVDIYKIKMIYLFSGKASVKHLTTTEDIGSPRLLDEKETIIITCILQSSLVPQYPYKTHRTFLGSHKCPQLSK